MSVEFQADAHRYLLDGQEVPNVTRILKAAGLIDARWFTDAAAQRGTDVHAACALMDDDGALPETFPPHIRGYCEGYAAFLRHVVPQWFHVETVVSDATLGYAGTLDRAGLVHGKPVVVDLKTGDVPPWAGVQTAAYRRCLAEPHTWGRAALQLTPNGRWSLIELTDRQDEAVFLAALTIYRWQHAHRGPHDRHP